MSKSKSARKRASKNRARERNKNRFAPSKKIAVVKGPVRATQPSTYRRGHAWSPGTALHLQEGTS